MSDSLSQFIIDNLEPILGDWESFTRTLEGGRNLSSETIRGDAESMLRFIVADMRTTQSALEQQAKSRGEGAQLPPGEGSASHRHGSRRLVEGFPLTDVIAEFRALRASVVRRWSTSAGIVNDAALLELTRFNEAIDQSLAEAVARYTDKVGKGRDTVLAVLSHDLRNPLSAVMMSGEAIENTTSDERVRGSARRIRQSSRRIESIISNLVDVTQVRLGGGITLDRTSCRVDEIFRAYIGEQKIAQPEREFAFSAAGDATISGDPMRLGQLAANLVGGPVRLGAQESPVDVTVRGLPDHVEIVVLHRGVVVPADRLETMFDPFVSGDDLPFAERSVSLGLFVGREIVRGHGGIIDARSSASGTQFVVHLPRSAEHKLSA